MGVEGEELGGGASIHAGGGRVIAEGIDKERRRNFASEENWQQAQRDQRYRPGKLSYVLLTSSLYKVTLQLLLLIYSIEFAPAILMTYLCDFY